MQALLMAVELYAMAAILWESIQTFLPMVSGPDEAAYVVAAHSPWHSLFGGGGGDAADGSGGPFAASAAAAAAAAAAGAVSPQLEL